MAAFSRTPGLARGASSPLSEANAPNIDFRSQHRVREMDDRTLLETATGDTELKDAALGEVAHRFRPLMKGIAMKYLHRNSLAEDAVQSALLKLCTTSSSYDGTKAKPESWLGAVTKNAAFDIRRKMSRRKELNASQVLDAEGEQMAFEKEDTSTPTPIATIIRNESEQSLHCSVEALPRSESSLIKFVHFENGGHSYQDAADAFEIPIGTVKSRLAKARGRLGEIIKIEEEHQEKRRKSG